MKTLNKLLCISLIVLTCITSIPLQGLIGADMNYVGLFTANAADTKDSGTCGENAKWKYDINTKTLTIYGKGEMDDYSYYCGVEAPYGYSKGYIINHVVITEGITRIGQEAFYNLAEGSEVKSVKIAESVKTIGKCAFLDAKFKEVTLPKNLKKIEDSAFYCCDKLKKIVIPDSVTTIERFAFGCCSSLEEIVFGSGIKEIDNVFDDCSKLTKVTLGKNIKSFNYDLTINDNNLAPVFVHKDNKYYSSDENGVLFNKKMTKLILYPGKISLKSYTVPKTVTTIADMAFFGADKLTSVNTSNVKKIGEYAFAYSKVKEIVLGSKLETIGEGAFDSCNYLKTLKVPAGVIKIGANAFTGDSNVEVDKNNKKYSTENGVLFNKDKTTLIRYSKSNTAKTYTIPETVTKISDYAFYDNKNLVTVNFPENLKTIGVEAFRDCDNLKSVSLSKNIANIGMLAFNSCDSLKKVTIAEGSTAVINECAFVCNPELSSISISSKIYKIGARAFADTKYVEKISAKNQNAPYYVGSVLCGIIGEPETIKIKEGTLGVASEALDYSCVKTLTIPASLKYIGANAFECTNDLTKITIDKNNKHFIMENGALLTKDKTRIIKYTSKTAKEYKAPDSVRNIDCFAFCTGEKLENIDFSSKVNDINITMFFGTKMYADFPMDEVIYYKKNAIEFMPDTESTNLIIIKSGTKKVTINKYTDSCFDAMYIPKSVTHVAVLPMEVYYEGSKEDWEKIELGEEVKYYFNSVKIHYNFKKGSNHSHKYYVSYKHPENCFANITTKYTCPCGDTYNKKGPVYESHIYCEKQYIEKKATLKNSGVKYDVCAYCDKKFNKRIVNKISVVKLSYTNTKYNGKVKTPAVTVYDSDGGYLWEGLDYTVKYPSGRKEVGTYYVTVTFKGDYSGTKELKFNIVPAK